MVVRNVGVALCDAHPGGNERQNNLRPPPSRRGVSCPATCPGALEGGQLQQPLEQPTLFYAVTLALALLGAGEGLNTGLAWLYVGLRVAHSLIQGDHQRRHAPLHPFHGGVVRSAGDVGACGAYRLLGCEVTQWQTARKRCFRR